MTSIVDGHVINSGPNMTSIVDGHVINSGPNMTSIVDDNVSKIVIQLTQAYYDVYCG